VSLLGSWCPCTPCSCSSSAGGCNLTCSGYDPLFFCNLCL
jgi:hypothetical protein